MKNAWENFVIGLFCLHSRRCWTHATRVITHSGEMLTCFVKKSTNL